MLSNRCPSRVGALILKHHLSHSRLATIWRQYLWTDVVRVYLPSAMGRMTSMNAVTQEVLVC